MRPLFPSSLSLLLFALVLPSVARAESPTSAADTGEEHLRGLELVLRPTLGSAGSRSPLVARSNDEDVPGPLSPSRSPYGLAAGAGLKVGYRFHPLVSGGLRGDIGTVSAEAPGDGTTDLSRGWQSAGLYVHAYPLALNEKLRTHIDPWIGIGVLYVHDGQSYRQNVAGKDGRIELDSHRLGIPIGVGVDYRVTRWFSAGPSFEYVIMNPLAGCATVSSGGRSQEICTNDTGGKDALVAERTGAWSFGLTLRATPF